MVDEADIDEMEDEETTPVRAPSTSAQRAQGDGFMASAWRAQNGVERWWGSLSKGRFARVLKMARKPEPDEFRQSSTVVLVGIGVIGLIGFLTYLFVNWLLHSVLSL